MTTPITFNITVWADEEQLEELERLYVVGWETEDWIGFDAALRAMVAEGPDVIVLEADTEDLLQAGAGVCEDAA